MNWFVACLVFSGCCAYVVFVWCLLAIAKED